MTSKLRRFGFLSLVAALGFASSAGAVQFRLLGWTTQDVNLQFESGPAPAELTVATDNLSPAYHHKSPGPLVLFKMVELEGKAVRQTACTVVVPPEAQQGIVLLVPGDDTKALSRKVRPNQLGFVSADAPLIYDYLWIDDSPAARPSGTIEFRNFSRFPIALQVGQQQLQLAPKAKAQVPLTKGAKRMPFKAAAQINGTWKLFATNPISTRNPDRMLVILRDGPASETSADEPNIRMISLYDWPTPVVDKKAQPAAPR